MEHELGCVAQPEGPTMTPTTQGGEGVDIYELLGEDRNLPVHRNARELVEADAQLIDDLVALRRRNHLSQTDVARQMGISPSAVSRFESGERDPHLSTIRRYAIAVGASIRHEVTSLTATMALESLPLRPHSWRSVADAAQAGGRSVRW